MISSVEWVRHAARDTAPRCNCPDPTRGRSPARSRRTRPETSRTVRLSRRLVLLARETYPEEETPPLGVRSGCLPCPLCQVWRDAGADPEGLPPCGHSAEEAFLRSRPCVRVRCRHNLYLDPTIGGALKLNFPSLEPEEMAGTSCSLDVADLGGVHLEQVAFAMNVTHERVRQIEVDAMRKLERRERQLPDPDDFERAPESEAT